MSVSQKEEAENVVAKQQPDEEHEHSSNGNGNGDAHATKLTEESGENGGDDTADGKAADGGGEEQDQAIPVSDDEETEETVQQPVDAGQQFQMQEGFYQQEIGDSFAPATVEPEELDEISIAREISSYIDVNRVNFGEIDSIEELWGLCDAISAAHSGLPDSLLKEAFHLVLEGHYGRTKNHWLRTHIEKLLRMWKKEMLKHKSTPRPTKFVASATYETAAEADVEKQQEEQPKAAGEDGASAQDQGGEQLKQLAQQQQPTEGGDASAQPQSSGDWAKLRRQRKQENKRKRALAVIMGVGQMLDHARKKFATEDGELDIEEDEYGNFSIGGMELSFEAWGQINKIKADDVVHSDVHVPAKRWKGSAKRLQNGASAATEAETKQLGANAPQPPSFSVDTPPTSASASGPSMAEQYPTVGEVEMPGLITTTKPKGKLDRKKAKLVEKKQRKADKDEGEISSSSESDEQSSSSSEESDGEKGGKSKHKKKVVLSQAQVPAARARDQRKARREEERQHGASSAQNLQVLLRKCFDLRGRIARKLSVQQKAMFMDVIRQSIAGTLQQQSGQNQHQALSQLMGAFARQSS